MMTDEEFREEFAPIHVPASFDEAKDLQEQVVFALADLGEGTAAQVAEHFEKLSPGSSKPGSTDIAEQTLSDLFRKGRITGNEQHGTVVYNLHKITHANDGSVDPHLLAPGLD